MVMIRMYRILIITLMSWGSLTSQVCLNDTVYSDVLFVVDNSMSISESDYDLFAEIILQTAQKVQSNCSQAQLGVVHYGGSFGQEVVIEYDLSNSNSIDSIRRQFCTNNCIFDGGDDLNAAMDSILRFLEGPELSNDPNNNLSIVIFTDASGTSDPPCAFDNCSTVRPYTAIDSIKSRFNASVTVVGASDEADEQQLAVYASTGGSYTGALHPDCSGTFDDCNSNRKYIPVQFMDDPDVTSDSIMVCVQCDIELITSVVVDAGSDRLLCEGSGDIITLTANATVGTPPFLYTWDNGLGAGASHNVAPALTTTYTVTATDANDCSSTDQVTVTVQSCGVDCIADTVYSDVLFIVDNSMSISESDYDLFAETILQTATKVQGNCPQAQIGVVHYGGANGAEVAIEYDLSNSNTIDSIRRQFCDGGCIFNGGDDLNAAMDSVLRFLNGGELSNSANHNLSIVIFTDASGTSFPCANQNCSVIRPYTAVDAIKTQFGASVTVVGASDEADASQLAVYASTGGSYTGALHPDCSGTFDDCNSNRKYIPVQFMDDPGVTSDSIVACVQCEIQIIPDALVDAGASRVICENNNESATLTASPLVGTAPFVFVWDNGLDSGQSHIVQPIVQTTYKVTMTDANMCMSVDSVTITPTTCVGCFANAGTPQPHQEICVEEDGTADIFTDENDGILIPDGYEEVYILSDAALTIIDYHIGKTTFTVSSPGLYRVHTLIAEVTNQNSPDYLDLDIIEIGESNLFLVVNCIQDHGVCADFDFPGRVTIVLGPEDMMCMTPENSINLCSDGVDNDNDGLVDCADEDCKELVNCSENTFLACNDLFDNDLDGLVDCFDPDCHQFVKCFERNEDCGDGIDNDGDGLVDCEDDSCKGSISCQETTAFTCIDGKDNDGDGLIDCEEQSCQRFIVCAETSISACQDGKDNDYDGLIDCADADCRNLLASCSTRENTAAFCQDGIDNDGDGLVDCADDQCSGQPSCGGNIAGSSAAFSLNITVLLEGAYQPAYRSMSTELNQLGYLPGQNPNTFFGTKTESGQPYNQAPWFYEGTEGINMGTSNKSSDAIDYDEQAVDWVLISLRKTENKDSEVWKAAGLLYADGTLEMSGTYNLPSKQTEYFVVVEHRNHLPIMSRTRVPIVNGTIVYDFSAQDAYTSIVGVGQIRTEDGRYAMAAGNGELVTDLSSDLDINARDLSCWLQINGSNSSYFLEDYDMNGDVNVKDRLLWEKNNGLFTTLNTK